MLRVIPFMILLAAFVMVATAGSREKTKTKPHRLSFVPNSSRKESYFPNKKLTSASSYNNLRPRLESTGCLPGSREMNPKFGCSRSSCRTKFPFTTAALCFGKQGNSCCKKVDFRKDHFEESECLSSCDVRTSGLDNHSLCRQRHPATLDADCRYFYDLFKSENGFENSFDTCCSAQYAYECPGTPAQRITAERFCDQKIDCPMATDEIGCNGTSTTWATTTTTPLATTKTTTLATTTTTTALPTGCTSHQFRCTRIFQCVNKSKKCDMVSDCKDGSDETTCTCADYLRKSDQSELICDDHVDCADQSDEDGCRTCAEHEQYSYLSSQCIPYSNICDGENHTLAGVDELNCVTLAHKSGKIELNRKGKPIRHSSGIVSILKMGVWKPVCAQNWAANVADGVCNHLGYGSEVSFNLVDPSSVSIQVVPPIEGFLWKTNENQAKESRNPSWHSFFRVDAGSGESPSNIPPNRRPIEAHALSWAKGENKEECKYANITCASQQCGTRSNIAGWDALSNMEGQYPWHASVFVNGNYLCGATLISSLWLMVAPTSAKQIDLTVDYVAVLLGARKFTLFAHPNEQISRIIRKIPVKIIIEDTVLLQLENPVQLNQYVNPICLASLDLLPPLMKKNHCLAVVRNGALLTSAISIGSLAFKGASTWFLKISWNKETIRHLPKYSRGDVICEIEHVWYTLAHFEYIGSSNTEWELLHWPHLDIITKIAACPSRPSLEIKGISAVCAGLPDIAPAPECPGKSSCWRCPLGACLSEDQVCDGVPNCRDRSDEGNCSLSLEPDCLPDQLPCGSRTCIPLSHICDGLEDCPDGRDESSMAGCPIDVFRCLNPGQNRSKESIPMFAVCNGTAECSNGVDETTCIALASVLPFAAFDKNGNPLELHSSGYLVARKKGTWSHYCSTTWGQKEAMAVCEVLGFTSETASFYQVLSQNAFNPTSNCPFSIHLSCGP